MGFEKLADLKQKLKTENKPKETRNSQQTTNKVDPVVLIIGRLQKLFPKAFPKSPAPKVALKVGILEDLQARSSEIAISPENLQLAIKTWCKSTRYWAATKEGAIRLDLDGNPAGEVEAIGAANARAMERKARMVKAKSALVTKADTQP